MSRKYVEINCLKENSSLMQDISLDTEIKNLPCPKPWKINLISQEPEPELDSFLQMRKELPMRKESEADLQTVTIDIHTPEGQACLEILQESKLQPGANLTPDQIQSLRKIGLEISSN